MKAIPNLNLQKKMRALVLSEFGVPPEVQLIEIPMPSKGEVLIKIDSSPINPSDNSFLKGMYSTKKPLPVVPGFEASGKVVATGIDFMSKRLLGKSVACFAPMDGNGTWAEYMITKNNMTIPLKKGVDIEQGSMLMVNPISVIAMLEIARKGNHSAIANTAAASALGRMMNRLCIAKNLPVVNIVRREEQVQLMKSEGAEYIVNSSSKNYHKELKSIFTELNVTLAFDAIAGQSVFSLMEALPLGGEVMVYGGLSEEAASVNPAKLIFEKKKLSGFWLSEWITHQSIIKMLIIFNRIQKLLSEKHQNTIHKRVTLEETVKGVSLYLEKMTLGKVLVKPWEK